MGGREIDVAAADDGITLAARDTTTAETWRGRRRIQRGGAPQHLEDTMLSLRIAESRRRATHAGPLPARRSRHRGRAARSNGGPRSGVLALACAAAMGVPACADLDMDAADTPTAPAGADDALARGAEEAFPGRHGETRRGIFQTATGPAELTYELIDGVRVFEGDIILPNEDGGKSTDGIHDGTTRAAGTYRWPGGVVPYTIDPGLANQGRVTAAIAHWEDNTNVDFVLRTNQADYVTFQTGTGCSSWVGRQTGQQFINLSTTCSTGSTIHEIGHTLGLWHEQSRTDRDDHIIINWNNIIAGKDKNFETYAARDEDGAQRSPYDTASIMHYGSFAFGLDTDGDGTSDVPTITRTDGSFITANRTAVTPSDVCAINRFYRFGSGSDFNGDGFADLAIGIPTEDLGTGADQGAVSVIWGSGSGMTTIDQWLHRDQSGVAETADDGDRFGNVIAVGDFNGDCLDDLAVGVPFDDVNGVDDAGSVHIFYSWVLGPNVNADVVIHQDTPGVYSAVEANDYFGYVLTAGDFNGDGYSDLAIGTPYEDNGSIANAGWVDVIYGSASGLDTATAEYWNQGKGSIIGSIEANDYFARALTAGDFNNDGFQDLAVGTPYEDWSLGNDGAVNVIYGSADGLTDAGNQLWTDDLAVGAGTGETSGRFGFAVTAGDYDGDGFADLAVSTPYRDVTGHTDAGAVTVLFGADGGLQTAGVQTWHQDVYGVLGGAGDYDYFGRALVAADFDGDGRDDLAIGAPYEDFSAISNPGVVQVLYGASGGLTSAGDQFWNQDNGLVDSAETSDLFGYQLAASDYNGDGYVDLAVGVPYEDVGSVTNAGAVHIIYSSAAGLTGTGNALLHQDSPNIQDTAEAYDYLGNAL